MSSTLLPLVPVSHLVQRVVAAAASNVSEGSRRNAEAALRARRDANRDAESALAAFRGRVPEQRGRRSAS